jgi:hypothetical protein
MHSPTALRILYLPAGLKRKLSTESGFRVSARLTDEEVLKVEVTLA